jgi:hypothetical protein
VFFQKRFALSKPVRQEKQVFLRSVRVSLRPAVSPGQKPGMKSGPDVFADALVLAPLLSMPGASVFQNPTNDLSLSATARGPRPYCASWAGHPNKFSRHHPRRRVMQYSRASCDQSRRHDVLDTPQESVIGLAEGEIRWRGMTPAERLAGSHCANGYRFAKWQGKPNSTNQRKCA